MKVPYSWLREMVDVNASPADVAVAMGVRGFAVEGLEALPDGDTVLDFEVTANRPDCTSVRGLAREVATAYDLPLKDITSLDTLSPGTREPFTVDIERPDLCGRYVGAFAAVSVAPAPEWLQARLRACGVRPINNVVDVTNYVLLELGQPMHAFDLTRLVGPAIRVRTAAPGEKIRTLDGQDRALTPEMLVIADAAAPVAVAGVMGGADSEVSASTRSVVLESASLQSDLGAPHQQDVGPEDRGQHAIRARRRSGAACRGHGARVRPAAAAGRAAGWHRDRLPSGAGDAAAAAAATRAARRPAGVRRPGRRGAADPAGAGLHG